MKSHLSSKLGFLLAFLWFDFFLKLKIHPYVPQIPNDKSHSSIDFKWNGVIVWRKDYRITAVKSFPPGTPWQLSGGCVVLPQGWVTGPQPHTKGGWHSPGTRNHQKEKSVLLEKKRKKTSQTPTFRFIETMGAVQLWGKLLHVTLLCTVASWVLPVQLPSRLSLLTRGQDAAVHAWECALPPKAKWMTEINIQNQLIVLGLKHPFCSFESSHFPFGTTFLRCPDAALQASFLHEFVF